MEIVQIPVKKISPSAFQPRETFDKEAIEELAESIKEFDLLNPILVKSTGDDTYQIIAGERRWRAAQFAGLKKIYARHVRGKNQPRLNRQYDHTIEVKEET